MLCHSSEGSWTKLESVLSLLFTDIALSPHRILAQYRKLSGPELPTEQACARQKIPSQTP
jgi:hypothetical protein